MKAAAATADQRDGGGSEKREREKRTDDKWALRKEKIKHSNGPRFSNFSAITTGRTVLP